MSPADRAVDPPGTASRSITTASTPASFAAPPPQIPAAPAPTMSKGTRAPHSAVGSNLTAFMKQSFQARRDGAMAGSSAADKACARKQMSAPRGPRRRRPVWHGHFADDPFEAACDARELVGIDLV